MLIEAKCPGCGELLEIDASFAGVKRPCKACGRAFTIERPARKAAEPKHNPNLFEAACPKCGAAERVSAALHGTPRACKKCRHLFVLQLPQERLAERAAQLAARAEAELGPKRYEVGCSACLREYLLAVEGSPIVRCQYCGAPADREKARTLAGTLGALRSRIRGALLEGVSARALLRGAIPELARETAHLLKLIHPELPAMRSVALEAHNRGEPVALGRPSECDRCLMPAALVPFRLVWSRVLEEARKLHAATAVTIFAGVVVSEKTQQVQRLSEVAYLCEGCRRSPPAPGPHYGLDLAQELPELG